MACRAEQAAARGAKASASRLRPLIKFRPVRSILSDAPRWAAPADHLALRELSLSNLTEDGHFACRQRPVVLFVRGFDLLWLILRAGTTALLPCAVAIAIHASVPGNLERYRRAEAPTGDR